MTRRVSPASSHDRARHGGCRGSHSGFTIIELMTVLIVLGILITVVVVPAVRGMAGRQRVQGVQAELLGDLQLARSEQAQRSGAAMPVQITFAGNADLTCYVIHTAASGIPSCNCTLAPGNACSGAAASSVEIKTMQFPRVAGVSVAASSPGGSKIVFAPPQGLATPAGLVIDVQDATSGQLRTTVSGTGVPSVCSPDGSIRGVATPC